MKKYLLIILLTAACSPVFSQKVDSIYFHLYTDSLKKGQHNYINVDGKLSNGNWVPLTSKELNFSSDAGEFDGNQLVIPENFKPQKVTVKAVLKSDPTVFIEKTIWIKQKPDGPLPTQEEILRDMKKNRNRN